MMGQFLAEDLLIRTSRCCRFVYLNEFTGTCSSIHSIYNCSNVSGPLHI